MTAERYVLVSGGAGHLGSAVVDRVVESGRQPVVLDRTPTARPGVRSLNVDLAEPTAGESVVRRLLTDLGAPDAVVLCHGWSPKADDGSPLPETAVSAELFNRVLATNLTSCFLLLQGLLPAMAQAGGGRVAVVGSAAAHTGRTNASAAYAASKAGLGALVRILAVRYAPDGVLLNDVSPGKIAHPGWPDSAEMIARYRDETPAGRLANAEEVADVIGFLISEKNTYLTGQSVIVDGGRLA
ncbi:MAG: SDR family oxidoreductase [Propionicimonas sp.]|jgi:3-oxoacyl-[acyl-carrier protein] reductase|nr:SDR family oxidoreductase [Tetrasphaera sp.]